MYCMMLEQIADFGMARDVADDNFYIASGGKVPAKWTAPEVATQLILSNYTYHAYAQCVIRMENYVNGFSHLYVYSLLIIDIMQFLLYILATIMRRKYNIVIIGRQLSWQVQPWPQFDIKLFGQMYSHHIPDASDWACTLFYTQGVFVDSFVHFFGLQPHTCYLCCWY